MMDFPRGRRQQQIIITRRIKESLCPSVFTSGQVAASMGAPTEHGATGKCDAWMIVNAALVGHFPQVFPQIEEKAEIGMRFSRHFCFSWELGLVESGRAAAAAELNVISCDDSSFARHTNSHSLTPQIALRRSSSRCSSRSARN